MKNTTTKHILAIFIIALFLAGCNQPGTRIFEKRAIPESTEEPETILNFMGHWAGVHNREKITRELAKEYGLKHPDVEVNMKFHDEIVGKWSQAATADLIVKMIETGNIEWDIVWIDSLIYKEVGNRLNDPYWGKKYLVDFSDISEFVDAHKSFIIEDLKYTNEMGGILAGPYIEGYYMTIYYNKDLAEKIGLEIPLSGMTFDQFLDLVAKTDAWKKDTNTDIGIIYDCYGWSPSIHIFERLYLSGITFEQAKSQELSLDKMQAFYDALKAYEELGKYDPLIKSYAENECSQTREQPLNDEVLFFVNGVWMYNLWMGIDEEKTQKMIPVELPVLSPSDHHPGGFLTVWAVMKDSSNVDIATDFLLDACSPIIAEKWSRYTKAPTGLKGHLTTDIMGEDLFAQFSSTITEKYNGKFAGGYGTNIGVLVFDENNYDMDVKITEAAIKLLTGKMTAEQAYVKLLDEADIPASFKEDALALN